MAIYDNALEHWPVAYETRQIPTRHGHTFVVTCGRVDAPALILLHGAGTNSAIWAGDVAAYSRHFRVFAVDLIGEAGKSAPNRPSWKGPAYSEWLEDVLNGLQLNRVTLLGISQGSWTALKYAVSHPERIEKLVLMCPGGIVPDKLSFLVWAIGLSLLGQWGSRRLVKMLYGGQPVPDEVENIVAVFMNSFKARTGILPIFSDDDLQHLTMPTLLLGGGKDALRDLDRIATRMRKFVTHMQVTIMPEAGHVLLNTTDRVLSFLLNDEFVTVRQE